LLHLLQLGSLYGGSSIVISLGSLMIQQAMFQSHRRKAREGQSALRMRLQAV